MKPVTVLDPDKLNFLNDNHLDPMGRVFEYEGNYYRACFNEATGMVDKLFSQGIVEELQAKGLIVPTKMTDIKVIGFGRVLEHQKVSHFVRPFHYTREMARQAALNWIDANILLADHGMGYCDAHYVNVGVGRDGNPLQVDFGSIIQLKNGDEALHQFAKGMVNPLLVLTKSRDGNMFRSTLDHFGPSAEELLALADIRMSMQGDDRKDLLQKLRELVAGLDLTLPGKTQWQGYYGIDPALFIENPAMDVENIPDLKVRLELVERFVNEHSPTSMLDVGGNTGYFGLYFAKQGIPTLITDTDEPGLDALNKRLWELRPGWDVGTAYISAIDTDVPYQGDLAIVMALTHHLTITSNYSFDMVASRLSQFTNNHLITEYMPHGLGCRETKPDPLPAHYTLDNCLKAFHKHFEKVELLEYDTPGGRPLRSMIFCSGKRS